MWGDPIPAWDEFYAVRKCWGKCVLVATPAGADLILEIPWEIDH